MFPLDVRQQCDVRRAWHVRRVPKSENKCRDVSRAAGESRNIFHCSRQDFDVLLRHRLRPKCSIGQSRFVREQCDPSRCHKFISCINGANTTLKENFLRSVAIGVNPCSVLIPQIVCSIFTFVGGPRSMHSFFAFIATNAERVWYFNVEKCTTSLWHSERFRERKEIVQIGCCIDQRCE